MPPQHNSGLTLDGSQVIVISGDITHQSDQNDAGSGTQPQGISSISPNLSLSGPDNAQALGGTSLVVVDVSPTKSELDNDSRQREAGHTGGRMWDGPPPEESDKAESTKTGPPAYSPGSTPPLPFSPSGSRPSPVLSSGAGRRSNSSKRLPLRRRID